MNDIERKFFTSKITVEKREDGTSMFRGHAAVFNSLSENLGGFREQIQEGAFDDVLQDDVRALFNHDPNMVLGRSKSGTLRISQDDKGLSYEVDIPDTSVGRDLTISMGRGDIDQSSFAFVVDEDDWQEDEEGRVIRTIVKVSRLYDVSPVTYPAYPDATVGLRGLGEFIKNKDVNKVEENDLDTFKRKLHLINLAKQ